MSEQNKRVHLVGVLNVTPDSFSDGGVSLLPESALTHARKLFEDGADYVDVGAEATNPWAEPITADDEWQRLESVLPQLLREFPGKISLDTRHGKTVLRAAEHGRFIINDITMFRTPDMLSAAAETRFPCIVSHITNEDVHAAHDPSQVISDIEIVRTELLDKLRELAACGVAEEDIILDPGIGFGKTMELNWRLLEFARLVPGRPVMIGYSRKRFLGEHRMEVGPNLEAAKTAIASGARYVRVHDVAAHRRLLATLWPI